MNAAYTIKSKVGGKDIFIDKRGDGMWLASCWCSVLHKMVQVPLTAEQVEEIISASRRCIDEILPDTPPPLREIFLTGLTPAEFEQVPDGE
jgi:hypothetical protein